VLTRPRITIVTTFDPTRGTKGKTKLFPVIRQSRTGDRGAKRLSPLSPLGIQIRVVERAGLARVARVEIAGAIRPNEVSGQN
jgi:hypothetical protein